MAKKEKKKAKKGKKSFSPTYWILVAIVVAIVVSVESAIIIFFGMLPSFINMLFIRGKGQQQKATILAMNAAGVFPFWVSMLTEVDPMGRVLAMTKDPFVWAIMWGAAMLGMFMMWGGGKMAEAVIDVFARNRIEKLRAQQADLVDEFGEDLERDAMRYLTGQMGDEDGDGDDISQTQD